MLRFLSATAVALALLTPVYAAKKPPKTTQKNMKIKYGVTAEQQRKRAEAARQRNDKLRRNAPVQFRDSRPVTGEPER